MRDTFALIAVMQCEKRFGDNLPAGLKNGSWDFATYKSDGTVAGKDLNTCRACHAAIGRQ